MMPGSPARPMVSAPSRKKTATTSRTHHQLDHLGILAGRHFVPFAVFFFPIVKRFAVDLVHRRVSDFHFARLPSQKEIDVVSFSIGSLHIYAGEIFPVAEVLQSIIVDLY